jgi:dTMP kinase
MYSVKAGKFIVFEGIDGCGKSTQLKLISSYLFESDKSNHIFLTREPTAISKYGDEVRGLLKESSDIKKDLKKFTSLYIKDRKFHVKKQILPMLKQGVIVLCDRYKYSTFAYQLAQGADLNYLLKQHENLIKPDLTIILDITAEEAMKRISKNTTSRDVFEKKQFLEKVRENYLKMPDIFKDENIVIINGKGEKEEVFKKIKEKVNKLF